MTVKSAAALPCDAQVLMGVRNKPDVLAGQKLLRSDHETPLQQDCATQAARFLPNNKRDDAVVEMEEILNFFMQTRTAEYAATHGWAELLVPFMALPMSRGDRYNCFYAMMAKYSFYDCSRKGLCFQVFRLLVLYHDPELCTFLDTRRIGPELYAQTWVRKPFLHSSIKKMCDSVFSFLLGKL